MLATEERLARVEQQVDNLASTLADVKMAIGDLRAEMVAFRGDVRTEFSRVGAEMANFRDSVDRRFEYTNQKIDRDFRSLVTLQAGTLIAIVGAVVGAYYK